MSEQRASDAERAAEFEARLREAAREPLSPEERKAQRLSFVVGMLGGKGKMTEGDIEEFIAARYD